MRVGAWADTHFLSDERALPEPAFRREFRLTCGQIEIAWP